MSVGAGLRAGPPPGSAGAWGSVRLSVCPSVRLSARLVACGRCGQRLRRDTDVCRAAMNTDTDARELRSCVRRYARARNSGIDLYFNSQCYFKVSSKVKDARHHSAVARIRYNGRTDTFKLDERVAYTNSRILNARTV